MEHHANSRQGSWTGSGTNRPEESWNRPDPYPQESKRIISGVLGLVLGYLGVHKFVLGYTTQGIIQIILTIVTCGLAGLIGFIEGIIYLTKTDEEFIHIYQRNSRPWF
jgi:TM2 domain-containing membrane protein YozV